MNDCSREKCPFKNINDCDLPDNNCPFFTPKKTDELDRLIILLAKKIAVECKLNNIPRTDFLKDLGDECPFCGSKLNNKNADKIRGGKNHETDVN